MTSANTSILRQDLARVFRWPRVKVALITCTVFILLMLPGWLASFPLLIGRMLFVGLLVLLAFGLFETWPARIPRWLARWALQVIGVAAAVPIGTAIAYGMTTLGDPQHWWQVQARIFGFSQMTIMGLLVSPWIAVAALLRQIKDEVRKQALTFELERSNYERNALDARLRLLQAQVAPHFLFNTLANVRELVSTGSPRAAPVLESLIAYLRAAVPRLNEPASTLGQELLLVEAYLDLMHMRMPDRLQFSVEADADARALVCPPMTLLTLVENAMRHGIDPAEEGGRIDVRASVSEGRAHAMVSDTGMGLAGGGRLQGAHAQDGGLGTGLANLRERLQLAFGAGTDVTLSEMQPHGVRADIYFPARSVTP